MALTREDLSAISELTSQLLEPLKDDMQAMKDDMQVMKDDIHRLDGKTDALSEKVNALQLHIENETDRNIRLIAENHGMLIDKLNKAIPYCSKEIVFDVEISSLKSRVSRLEEKVG